MYDINNPVNVNPIKWGPLFWMLLHTIAKFAKLIPSKRNDSLNVLVSTIPYILPCNECGRHCKEIYDKNKYSKVSISTFSIWVWKLRTEVNKNTRSHNISYEEYISRLHKRNYHISKEEYIELLGYISMNYPYDESHDSNKKRKNVYLFIKSFMELVVYIYPLQTLSNMDIDSIWMNKIEFQKWITNNCYKLYGYKPRLNI